MQSWGTRKKAIDQHKTQVNDFYFGREIFVFSNIRKKNKSPKIEKYFV